MKRFSVNFFQFFRKNILTNLRATGKLLYTKTPCFSDVTDITFENHPFENHPFDERHFKMTFDNM